MRKASDRRSKFLIIVLFVLCGAMEVVNSRMSAMGIATVPVFGLEITASGIKGIIQAAVSLLSVLMVCIEYKMGRLLACIGQVIATINMITVILRMKEWGILPGLIFTLVTIVSVLIIANQFEKLEKASVTDDVTMLMNRPGFMEETAHRIDRKNLGYVAFVQIKDFRSINDNLGHAYGDLALKIIADRIKAVVGDSGTVCRLDGTEFAIAFSPIDGVKEICYEVIRSIGQKITLEHNDTSVNWYLGAFIGVATYGSDSEDVDVLMKYADIAMYTAAYENKERVCFFNIDIEHDALRREEIQRITQDSLENDYFYLVYQPQFVTDNHELRGFETLLRCKLPDGTFIPPADFIEAAEMSELIVDIDDYVLRRAMTEFKDVVMNSPKHFMLSINVSAKSMASVGFSERIKAIISETGFPAERLEIEITEYSFAHSHEQTFLNVIDLRDIGVKVALDDFGTGYTSLAQLLKLPITLVKIDKSLIDGVEQSRVNRDFVDSVIYMGHLMGCEVIAEGVENEAQLNLLREHKCDYIQGYVWSRPLDYPIAIELTR